MRSRSGNPLPALLLTLPMIAIPLMAVFGVPQFVPVIASSVSEDAPDHDRHQTRRSVGVGESIAPIASVMANSPRSLERSSDDRLNDLFRPAGHTRSESRPMRGDLLEQTAPFGTRSSLTSTSDEVAMSDSRKDLSDLFGSDAATPDFVDLRSTNQTASRAGAATSDRVASNHRPHVIPAGFPSRPATAAPDGLTWRRAVQRLNELGIDQFRLEPGRDNGDFYFACEFSPDQDSRITRRFEAEAAEPLQAVELVLRQINEWTLRR